MLVIIRIINTSMLSLKLSDCWLCCGLSTITIILKYVTNKLCLILNSECYFNVLSVLLTFVFSEILIDQYLWSVINQLIIKYHLLSPRSMINNNINKSTRVWRQWHVMRVNISTVNHRTHSNKPTITVKQCCTYRLSLRLLQFFIFL